MKSLMPIILIIAAVGLFFMKVNPLYSEVSALRAESKQYDEALDIAKELEQLRSELSTKLESFSQSDLARLDHFLPRRLDTVRIILDLDGIASRYGIKLDGLAVTDATPKGGNNPNNAEAKSIQSNVVTVTFNFKATYAQATQFIRDTEKSLRLFDGVNVSVKSIPDNPSQYDFNMTLNTYWINR